MSVFEIPAFWISAIGVIILTAVISYAKRLIISQLKNKSKE